MSEIVFVGVDGGGSNVRAVATDAQMNILAEMHGTGINPSIIGWEEMSAQLTAVLRQLAHSAVFTEADVCAVGVGIAGLADPYYASALTALLKHVFPSAQAVTSTDFEIALVGARGRRQGILILAGTGSVAFGVSATGEQALVGGWGYLLGDEGSGSWIGKEALRLIVRAADQGVDQGMLARIMMHELGAQQPRDIVRWLYGSIPLPIREMAALAQHVINAADAGDGEASNLLDSAADHLVQMVATLQRRLHVEGTDVVFAGGLLEEHNALSRRLCARLRLVDIPPRQFPPVVGAALLAKLVWETRQHEQPN